MNVLSSKKSRRFPLSGIQINHFILTVVFLFLLGFPIIRMFFNLNRTSVLSVFQNPSFVRTLSNSLQIATISTVITLSISYLLAYCIERTKIKHKGTFSILLVLPMLIPSISHGMGLILLLGNNGILTRLFHLNTTIYGKWGIIVGSVFYAFPVAFLMFVNVLKYEDSTPYEAAQVLGIPKWRQLTALTFPYLRRPLISIVFAIFTMIITDYGVPIIVGGKYSTLPVVLYQEVIGQLNFAKGSVYGVLLLIPASIAFLFDVLNADKGNTSYVTHPFELQKNALREVLAYGACILACLLVFLPIFSFAILAFTMRYPSDLSATFRNVVNTFNLNGGTYLINSITIAIAVALLGTFIAFSTAYLTARVRTPYSKYLHLFTITSTAVPGIVLGLSYVLVFKTSFIYGTLAILIMVNLVHFISAPYLMMYDSLGKINENLEAVGQTLGIGRLRMIKDIFIPQSKSTILEMASYFFVNCMMTISAVSFLATTSNKPVSLMINQFEAQMQLENVAVVSLAILIINLAMKTLVKTITGHSSKHDS